MEQLECQLLKVLLYGKILHAPALPFSTAGFFADMGLISEGGNAKVVGESLDTSDGEELFFLNLDEFDPDAYWLDQSGHSAWPPPPSQSAVWTATDLAVTFRGEGFGSALEGNREVKFYRSPQVVGSGRRSRGVLQSAAAFTFENRGSRSDRFMIFATPSFPTSLEVILVESRIRSILASLEEFRLE